MPYNRPSGEPLDELLERAAAAIVRVWSGDGELGDRTGNGVTIEQAREAVRENFVHHERLGPDIGPATAWPADLPEPREPVMIDLTAEWVLYLDGPTARIVAA